MAYVAWMASFTETVEKHNPAATATGLAIWGWILRIVVTASLAIFTLVVPATSILVDQGTRVSEIAAAAPEGGRDRLRDRPGHAAKALRPNPTDVDALSTAARRRSPRQQGASDDEAAGGRRRRSPRGLRSWPRSRRSTRPRWPRCRPTRSTRPPAPRRSGRSSPGLGVDAGDGGRSC